jgi:hypothetical protein
MSAEVKVRNVSQAVESALAYLREQAGQSTPAAGSNWREKTLYATGVEDYAVTSKLFMFGDWMVEVYQGIAPVSSTIYQITVFNPGQRLYWKGSIKADGTIREESPLTTLSEEGGRKLAEELTKKINVPPPKPGGYGH